jgi:hypothetical protein
LNTTSSALALNDSESSDLQNIDFNRFGSIIKRNGYTTLNSAAFNGGATWVGLHWFQKAGGTNLLTGVCGDTIAKMDALDGTWDDITETQAVVFTGAGLDDATSGGTFTGDGDIEYKVVIDATGTPDTFEWFKDSVSQAAGVSITGASQALDNGLTITFAATTGHTLNDQWVFHPATTITAGDNNLVSSITYRDTWLATNGVDRPFQWDGVTALAKLMTVPTGLTKAKFVEVFQNYTILANVTVSGAEHKSRVYWSTIGQIGVWSATDFNNVSRDDGSVITGLKTLGQELIIFKEFSIWKAEFTGSRDVPFAFTKTRSNVGAVAGHSVQEIDNRLMFRSQDGWYLFDGNNSQKISNRINVTVDGFNDSRAEFTASAYQKSKNRYWSSASNGAATQNDTIMPWDSSNNAWSRYIGFNANVFAIVTTSGEERIYFGDYAGFVYRADTGTSDNPLGVATAIDAYYKSKWFDFGDIVHQKGVPSLTVYYQTSSTILTFAYSFDFEDADQYTQTFSLSAGGAVYGSAIFGTDVYGSSGGAVRRRDLTGRGRVVRIKFANAVLNEPFQIDGFGPLPYLETPA